MDEEEQADGLLKSNTDTPASICAAVAGLLRSSRLADIMASEIQVFYYALFTWRAKPQSRPGCQASTTYEGAIETAEEFGLRVWLDLWIWNIAGQHFPAALQIVDKYHARQHLWEISVQFFPDDQKEKNRWARKRIRTLKAGRIKSLVTELRAVPRLAQELQAAPTRKLIISSAMPRARGIQNSARLDYSWALA